jgi:hypothetical protein
MDALFLISIGCFLTLFLAALGIARHIRLHGVRGEKLPEAKSLSPASVERETPQWTEQDLHILARRKQPDWRFLVSEEHRDLSRKVSFSFNARKPPASVRGSRPDGPYFSQDLGDLRDPYGTPQQRTANGGYKTGRSAHPLKGIS